MAVRASTAAAALICLIAAISCTGACAEVDTAAEAQTQGIIGTLLRPFVARFFRTRATVNTINIFGVRASQRVGDPPVRIWSDSDVSLYLNCIDGGGNGVLIDTLASVYFNTTSTSTTANAWWAQCQNGNFAPLVAGDVCYAIQEGFAGGDSPDGNGRPAIGLSFGSMVNRDGRFIVLEERALVIATQTATNASIFCTFAGVLDYVPSIEGGSLGNTWLNALDPRVVARGGALTRLINVGGSLGK